MVGVEARNGGCDQMLNGADLFRVQAAATTHFQHDGGTWFLLFAAKEFPAGQNQMHPRGLYAIDDSNGPGQFAFQRSDEIDVLDKIGCAQSIRFIENLVPHGSVGGQALTREFDTQRAHLVGGNANFPAIVHHFVRDAPRLQPLNDGAGGFRVQVAVKQGHGGRCQTCRQVDEQSDHAHGHDAEDYQSSRAKASDNL